MYEVVVEPAIEPLTVGEAKQHLRVDIDDDNDYIAGLISAARRYCEKYLARKLIATTVDQYVEHLPAGGYWNRSIRQHFTPLDPEFYPSNAEPVKLDVAPVLRLDSLRWTDGEGVEQFLESESLKLLRREGGCFARPSSGVTWPSPATDVRVRYVVGYGDDAKKVPSTIKHAVRLLIGTWYDTRESIVDGVVSRVPDGVERLLGLESWGADYS